MTKPYRSVSALCRDLGINRTQFNRYLAGESFPRPDILAQICTFFGVDARILLEPIETATRPPGVFSHPYLQDYLGLNLQTIPEEVFPTGFYRFSRESYVETDLIVLGIIYVFRRDNFVFVRGYEARNAMRKQGLPLQSSKREFRGVVTPQDDGVAFNVAHRNNAATTFNYLCRVATYQNSYWVGYTARPCRETVSGRRVTRLVYEHLDMPFADIMKAARATGYTERQNLPPFHERYLRLQTPFV
ncbi:hypothetical protein NBRC116594_35410 [Shimia sp. NS0008-38b]|uniref:helix-turn-helix domain-containing protein n=1 Tax=Shimia sp. NS0008-38b TaxID=3127653 RepID=UPI0031030168